jgi:hypothetical protein
MTATGDEAKLDGKKETGDKNIDASATRPPAWDSSKPAESLDALYGYCEAQTASAIAWYYQKKKGKAVLSYWLRILTIVASALGGLTPVLTAFFFSGDGDQLDRLRYNQLGFLSVGLAAMFLALDRFTGSSTGWMRYIGTALAIETLLEEFRLDWSVFRAARRTPPTDEQINESLTRVKKFVLALRAEITKETQAWITEFQSNITHIEEEARSAWESARAEARKEVAERDAERKRVQEAERPGAIMMKVASQAPIDTFSVDLDGRPTRQNVTGKTCGIVGVSPGLHEVSVSATSGGKKLHASQIVTVKGNETSVVEVTLS